MFAFQTDLRRRDQYIAEGTTPRLTVVLRDNAGAVLTDPDYVRATLYDTHTGDIINGRDYVDLLALDPPVVTEGVISWQLDQDDTAMLTLRQTEKHVLLLEYGDGNGGHWKHEVIHYIVNLAMVPREVET